MKKVGFFGNTDDLRASSGSLDELGCDFERFASSMPDHIPEYAWNGSAALLWDAVAGQINIHLKRISIIMKGCATVLVTLANKLDQLDGEAQDYLSRGGYTTDSEIVALKIRADTAKRIAGQHLVDLGQAVELAADMPYTPPFGDSAPEGMSGPVQAILALHAAGIVHSMPSSDGASALIVRNGPPPGPLTVRNGPPPGPLTVRNGPPPGPLTVRSGPPPGPITVTHGKPGADPEPQNLQGGAAGADAGGLLHGGGAAAVGLLQAGVGGFLGGAGGFLQGGAGGLLQGGAGGLLQGGIAGRHVERRIDEGGRGSESQYSGVNMLDLARFTAKWEVFKPYVYDDGNPTERLPQSSVYRDGGQYKNKTSKRTATIGFGTTRADIIDLYWNRDMTLEEATKIQAEQLPGYVDQAVHWIGKDRWATLNPNQRAAVADLFYNAGSGNIAEQGTALQSAIRSGADGRALEEIWKGTIISPPEFRKGLIRRRQAEYDLYSS